MSTFSLDDVWTKIDEIEGSSGSTPWSPTRFPYTYAYDYLRSHGREFGIPDELTGSRSEMAGWSKANFPAEDREFILECLAEAYMREWNIVRR